MVSQQQVSSSFRFEHRSGSRRSEGPPAELFDLFDRGVYVAGKLVRVGMTEEDLCIRSSARTCLFK